MGKDADLGYVAAVIDCEGTITLSADDRPRFRPYVTYSNTNPTIISFCQRIIGGHVQTVSRNGHKAVYFVDLHSNELEPTLKQLIPYLKGKRAVAELLLEYIRIRKEHSGLHGYTRQEILLALKIRELSEQSSRHFKDTSTYFDKVAIIPDTDELRELYINQGYTQKQLGRTFTRNQSTIKRWLKRYNLRRHDRKGGLQNHVKSF